MKIPVFWLLRTNPFILSPSSGSIRLCCNGTNPWNPRGKTQQMGILFMSTLNWQELYSPRSLETGPNISTFCETEEGVWCRVLHSHLNVTHISSAYILLSKASQITTPNSKEGGKRKPTMCQEKKTTKILWSSPMTTTPASWPPLRLPLHMRSASTPCLPFQNHPESDLV